MKNNKGFTLVELLAVIVVLDIVVGLTIYIAINAINRAKEKSYQVTIANIEKNASNYLTENSDKLFFISSNDGENEYQCITIKELIEFGHLKNSITNSKISKDALVKLNDYVYLERDAITKAIVKATYKKLDDTVCSNAIKATEDIAILVMPSTEYAKEREVTINYKLKNLNDINELNKYTYHYTYDGEYTTISDDTKLYFFKILNPFAVKIILTNENDTFENDLATIINILSNASYDYDSDKLYNYHMYAPNDNLAEKNNQ